MPSQGFGQSERGLRLLSIDGGGIRGLSPLLILKEILYRLQQEKQLQDLPRPCDVFDLAGGTSTGGLIVIMLFRLRMSVDEAIHAYASLAKHVFSVQKWFFQDGKFKASKLEDAIVAVIQGALKISEADSRSLRMLDEEGAKCFVCAMPAGSFSFPSLFRTWTPVANQTYNCTILEATRATSAAPTFFKGIEFGKPIKQRYLDGGLGFNNPVKLVIQEAESLFPNCPISAVVSLGTGAANVIGLNRPDAFQKLLPTNLIGALKGIATDCEKTSEQTARELSSSSVSYYRLNVDQGLQGVSLAEWEKLEDVQLHTLQYLQKYEVGQRVDQLVQMLKAGHNASTMKTALPVPPTELTQNEREAFDKLEKSIAPSAYHDSRMRSRSSGCLPGTRRGQIESISNWIEMGGEKKPLFVVMGPAGSGKTSLLNTIAQICKENGHYAAGFFFSGTDADRNNDGRFINTIAYQMAETIPEFRPYVARAIASEPSLLNRSLESQMRALLLEPLRQLWSDYPGFSSTIRPLILVVDALDECGKLEDQRRVVAALNKLLSFPFTCLLSSRFNTHIEHEISTTLTVHVHDRAILGKNGNAEKADIRAYLHASIERIREQHAFGKRMPQGWPSESHIETVVQKSGGQFIFAATVIRYMESPDHNPHERLRSILGSSCCKEDLFAELDALYLVLMSSVKKLPAALEILGIELLRSSSQFWTPQTMKYNFNFNAHFRSLDADVVLAPLTSVLKCEDGNVEFYHLSFAEFLLDSTRSREYFVHPKKWQKWIVSSLVPSFYDGGWIWTSDVQYLVKEAKPGTDLHQAINEGLVLVDHHPKLLPSGGDFNIWPFVTYVFFRQLWFQISIDKMTEVFVRREENFLPLPVLLKLAPTSDHNNSFLLLELCRTCVGLLRAGFIRESLHLQIISPYCLSHLMTYLADFLDNQHCLGEKILSPEDYTSAMHRCLWYLQSSSSNIRSSLTELFRSLRRLPQTFGISGYLEDTTSNLTRGALAILPTLLAQTPPSMDLFSALKRPFNSEVILRTPSSFHDVLHSIHNYLTQHDPVYERGGHMVLGGQSYTGEDEPPADFKVFLYREGNEIPRWIKREDSWDETKAH